jgi:thiosulfate/3-mercaptopyruvate sulfurtransferase
MSLLIDTATLAARLGDSKLRIFDCNVRLVPDPVHQYRVEDCRADYRAGHIPGAGYIDLHNDLSDKATDLRFMMPAKVQFEAAMSRYGIDDTTDVVLYSKGVWYWATRIWWMLKSMGFNRVSILDGAFTKWQAEGRPVATGDESYPPARFVARPRAGLWVGKDAVKAAIGDGSVCTLNALTREQHEGTGGTAFGRPGRIKGSVNVSSKELVDPKTNALLPMAEIERRYREAGVLDKPRTIVYCGGGISASGNAFLLTLLGRKDVAIYDGSLNEWGPDAGLPMEIGRT